MINVSLTQDEIFQKVNDVINSDENNSLNSKDQLIAIRSIIQRYIDKDITKRDFINKMIEQERILNDSIKEISSHIDKIRYISYELSKIKKITIVNSPKIVNKK